MAEKDGENCSESALHFGLIFVGQQLEDGRAVPAKSLVGVELNPGPTYCQHGRQGNKSKDCGTSSICQHSRQKISARIVGAAVFVSTANKAKLERCGAEATPAPAPSRARDAKSVAAALVRLGLGFRPLEIIILPPVVF